MWPAYYGRTHAKRLVFLQSIMISLLTNPNKTIMVLSVKRESKKELVDFARHWGVELDIGRQRQHNNLWQFKIRGYKLKEKR